MQELINGLWPDLDGFVRWIIETYLEKAPSGHTCIPMAESVKGDFDMHPLNQTDWSPASIKVMERALFLEIDSIY